MSRMTKRELIIRLAGVLVFFAALFYAIYSIAVNAPDLSTDSQRVLYPVGLATLLSGMATLWLSKQMGLFDGLDAEEEGYGKSFFPILSGFLALIAMSLAYVYIGMWPVGPKSAMIVDMHHQYAPLLQQLRDTLLHGDSLLYSFDLGLGASYIPLIGYYLASPLNLIMLLFPARLLPEALLVITLLKNMLSAALMAACLQYVYKKRTYAIPVISVMFSMMMYLIAYSWCIMWLDCVMVLPLIVLGFEKLMRENKPLIYVLALAYALYVNYFIAFMLCLFLVLYFFVYSAREKRATRDNAAGFLKFGGYSVIAAMLASFALIPVALSLGQTSAASGGFAEVWSNNFDIFELLGRHLYDVSPTIRSGNLPNIYCGVLAVLLVPLYATTRAIPRRRRGMMMGLLAVMAFSMVLNNVDLLWHGLHAPNDLPYRFSFLYSFVLLLIGYETLLHFRDLSAKQIGFSFVGILAYLVVEEHFGEEVYDFRSLYISLALVALYAMILLMMRYKRMVAEAGYVLLSVIVLAELVTGTGRTFIKMNQNEYFTAHADYVDNDITAASTKAVETMEALGDEATDNGFYRLEFVPRRTCVDTAMFDYNGITIFASSNPYENTRFMGGLGYAINGVNSYLYHAFAPMPDSLLGLRYVAATGDVEIARLRANPLLTEKQTVSVGDVSYTIFENPTALSIGYFADSAIRDWDYNIYNPFDNNNGLLSAMTGSDAQVYEYQSLQAGGDGTVVGTYAFSAPAGGCDFVSQITESGHVYAYVDCRAATGIDIVASYAEAKDGMDSSDFWSVSPHEPYIIDAGHMDAGDTLRVTISNDATCGGNIYVVRLNDEVYKEQMATLAKGQMDVTTYTDTRIEGTMTAPRDGMVFTSVVYDPGWTVLVDGQPVETYATAKSMLSFDVTAGDHTVTMTFFPSGLKIGLVLTAAGLILLVLIVWGLKHPDRVRAWKDRLFRSKPAATDKTEGEPADEATDEPDESIEEPINELTDETTETSTDEATDEATKAPVDPPTEAPAEPSADGSRETPLD
ncbi:MAG: YfhO family protein [Clostridia bacterium]|nr:YfhO family protein [Clostridia bacterium]